MTDDLETVENQAPVKEQASNKTTPKVARRTLGCLGGALLEIIFGVVVGTPIGFFILYVLLFQPKFEYKSPKRYDTQTNIVCSEEYVKKWRKLRLSGEISRLYFTLKDGADEEAGIFSYEGDLHVRIDGRERNIVKRGVLDESVVLIKPNMEINEDDSPYVIGHKLGLNLATIILFFLNTEIKEIEGAPQVLILIPIIKKPGMGLAAHTLFLGIESDTKEKLEFSTDGQNWQSLPFPSNQLEKIFGPLLDVEELNRREKLRQKKADELKEKWDKWRDAAKKGKEKIEDVKEKLEQGKEKIEQGRALLERGRNLLNKKEDEEPDSEP